MPISGKMPLVFRDKYVFLVRGSGLPVARGLPPVSAKEGPASRQGSGYGPSYLRVRSGALVVARIGVGPGGGMPVGSCPGSGQVTATSKKE